MTAVLGMSRFVNYKGDSSYFTKMALAALDVKKDKAAEEDEGLEQYMEIIFEKPLSLENEMDCWYLILWKIDDALMKYPTTL